MFRNIWFLGNIKKAVWSVATSTENRTITLLWIMPLSLFLCCSYYSGFQCILPSNVGVSFVPIKLSVFSGHSLTWGNDARGILWLTIIKNVSSALNFNYRRQSMCTGIERLLTHKRTSYANPFLSMITACCLFLSKFTVHISLILSLLF